MRCISQEFSISSPGRGLHEITDQVQSFFAASAVESGILTIFIKHTSASLTIQENADPSAKRDLENWLNRLVPENQPEFTHTLEGPDDMPAHIKAALTSTSLSIPIVNGALALGTWQGIYLWEHRRSRHTRKLTLNLIGQ